MAGPGFGLMGYADRSNTFLGKPKMVVAEPDDLTDQDLLDASLPDVEPSPVPIPPAPRLMQPDILQEPRMPSRRQPMGMGGVGRARQAYDGALGELDELEIAGALEQGRNERDLGQGQVDALDRYERDMDMAQVDADAKMLEIDEFGKAARKAADEADDIDIEDDQWWRTRKDGDKAAAFLGAAISGFRTGDSGGPNQFLQRLDKHVEQNIQGQLRRKAGKQAKANRLLQQYDQMRERGLSDAEARRSLLNRRLEIDDKRLIAKAQMSGSALVLNNAMKSVAARKAERAKEEYTLAAKRAAAGSKRPDLGAAVETYTKLVKEGMDPIEAANVVGSPELMRAALNQRQRGGGLDPTMGLEKEEQSKLQDLSKREESYAAAQRRIAELRGYTGTEDTPKKSPGAGPFFESFVPRTLMEAMGSDESARVNRFSNLADNMFQDFRVATTGAGASESELDMLREAYGIGPKYSNEQNIQGVMRLQRDLDERMAAVRAGYTPKVRTVFDRQVQGERRRNENLTQRRELEVARTLGQR